MISEDRVRKYDDKTIIQQWSFGHERVVFGERAEREIG